MPKLTRTHLFALLTAVTAACGGTTNNTPPVDRGFPTNGTLIAQGSCEGRAGHDCVGTVGLYRLPDNTLAIGLQSNFRVTDIPGPRLYYSSRDALVLPGSNPPTYGIDASADIILRGGPRADQNDHGLLFDFNGSQGFTLPAGAEVGRSWFWVYCEPFQVEVARAQLNPLPAAQ